METIKKEIQKNETVDVLETVIFTNIVEKHLKAMPLSQHIDIIGFIACEFNLKLSVSKTSVIGNLKHFEVAKKILINCVKNN